MRSRKLPKLNSWYELSDRGWVAGNFFIYDQQPYVYVERGKRASVRAIKMKAGEIVELPNFTVVQRLDQAFVRYGDFGYDIKPKTKKTRAANA